MGGLLLIERAILEALTLNTLSARELANLIGIDLRIVKNSIKNLMEDKLISYTFKGYVFNERFVEKTKLEEINSSDSLSEERLDFAQSLDNFKVVKMSLNSFEEKIFELHLRNLNEFIDGVRSGEKVNIGPPQKGLIKDQKVIAFGVANYGEVLKKSLSG